MIGQMNNIWDKVAWVILVTGKVYLIGAVAMLYVMPSMTPFFLGVWALHWSVAVCIAFWRQIEIHAIAKERFPFLYEKSIFVWTK